jgi:hypothetical protein
MGWAVIDEIEIEAEFANGANATMPPFQPFSSPDCMRPFPLLRLRGLLRAEPQFAVALPEAERLFGLNRRFAEVVRRCGGARVSGRSSAR